MKKTFLILLIGICTGCPFPVIDPPRDNANVDVRNYSDRPIYVYSSWDDSLTFSPSLSLFECISYEDTTKTYTVWRSADTIYCPSYRIDAYDIGGIYVSGTRKKPMFPNRTDTLTLFFIMEETMRNNSWGDIWCQQMYVKKVSFSEIDMQRRGWRYTYYP